MLTRTNGFPPGANILKPFFRPITRWIISSRTEEDAAFQRTKDKILHAFIRRWKLERYAKERWEQESLNVQQQS